MVSLYFPFFAIGSTNLGTFGNLLAVVSVLSAHCNVLLWSPFPKYATARLIVNLVDASQFLVSVMMLQDCVKDFFHTDIIPQLFQYMFFIL